MPKKTKDETITEVETVETAMVPVDALPIAKTPAQVLADGHESAAMLQKVISTKKKPVMIRGEQYLEFEDWQTLGQFYRVTARVVAGGTRPVEAGGTNGWEAHAELIHLDTGAVLGGADSMCMNDEDKWRGRPQFMLRSMAQTRACAKALRNRLAWVAVLAGFRPTPAEEMDGVTNDKAPPKRVMPKRASAAPKAPPVKAKAAPQSDEQPPPYDPTTDPDYDGVTPDEAAELMGAEVVDQAGDQKISMAQRKRFYAKYKQAGITDEVAKTFLSDNYGISSTGDIKRKDYDDACQWTEK